MIPGAFSYHRADSKAQALQLLNQFGDEGRVLAGGHSLIPMMKLRLATPAHLVDITRDRRAERDLPSTAATL